MSDQPKQGVYLDAALAVIGEQVDERIDQLSRRRRARNRIGVAALAVVTVASGSVAAVAVGSAVGGREQGDAAAPTVAHEVRCIEGARADGEAYFTVRYRVVESELPDLVRVCADAWAAIQSDTATLLAATPDELVARAEGMLADAGGGSPAASEAAFGPISHPGDPAFVPCAHDDATTVLALAAEPATPPRVRGGRVVTARNGRLPGPVRRLWRQPLRVAALVLLAVTALAAAGIQSAAAQALRATLDQNWRGAYDILVTAEGGLQPVDGMLRPNALATGGALSLDDVETLRRIDGVEVAAPLGEIAVPALKIGMPAIAVPTGFVDGADEEAQAFRLTITYTTDDGLGERLVEQQTMPLVVDETPREPIDPERFEQCMAGSAGFDGFEADRERYPALMAAVCATLGGEQGETLLGAPSGGGWSSNSSASSQGFATLSLPSTPSTITRITLIDPAAERQLLGDAGAFLDPLVATRASAETDSAALAAWAATAGGGTADEVADQLADMAVDVGGWGYSEEAMADLRRLYRDNGADFDQSLLDATAAYRFMPLLIADDPVAELDVKIDVEAFGTATRDSEFGWVLPAGLDGDAAGVPVGSTAADVSSLLNPFMRTSPAVVWPGAELSLAEEASQPSSNQLMAVGDVIAAADVVTGEALGLRAVEYRNPTARVLPPADPFAETTDGGAIGAEAVYAGVARLWETPMNGNGRFAMPIGFFSSADLAAELSIDEQAANYVPLGAYAPVSSTLTAGEHAGTTMLPSLAGLGLVSPRTVAIGSLHSAALWEDETPVSAVRVRVGGIDAYTPTAVQRIVEVAQAVEALGFDATIVAGSSPADADVLVDGYAFGTTDPAGAQTVGTLGTVTQRWSELGAASRVSTSVSTATLVILGIALAAGILLLGAVQVSGIPGRREQAVVMREIGLPRPRIARWFAGEELPGLVVVAVVGAIAWWLSGGTAVAAVAAGIAFAAVLLAAVVSVIAGSQARRTRLPHDARSRRLGARSVAGFGVRQAFVHPLTTTVHVLAIVIVGLAATALAVAVIEGRDAAGASSLALLTLARQLVPQVALGLAGVAGGILLARLTRRLDLARRADQWATLRAAGWTSAQLTTAQRAEGVAIVVPALVLTSALAWSGALWLDLSPVWLLVTIGVVAGLLTALTAFSTRRKGTA